MRVVTLRQPIDEIVRPGNPGGTLDFFLRRVRLAIADVVADGIRKELRLLKHVGHLITQTSQRDIVNVSPIDTNGACAGIVKSRDQIGQAGLARPGRSHQRRNLAYVQRQIDIAQRLATVRIGHAETGHLNAVID